MTKIYIHAGTHVHMKIESTTVKVMSSEIASSTEIKNVISYFLGAGWRIWPSNYSFCFSKLNGCDLDKYINKIKQARITFINKMSCNHFPLHCVTHWAPSLEGDQSGEQWCGHWEMMTAPSFINQYTGRFINDYYVLFHMTALKKSERAFLHEFRILSA